MKNISIVTGGNSGLGFELCKVLLLDNQNICIICRNEDKLCEAIRELNKLPHTSEILSYIGDVSSDAFAESVLSSLTKDGYSIKRLFNSAGVGKFSPPEKNTRELIDTVFCANLIGLIVMSSHVLNYMKADGGTIVNILSTSALKCNEYESVYCASKWGARGFSESLRVALKNTNIKVVSIYPAGINTEFWSEDCGFYPDLSTYMDPIEVARQVYDSIENHHSMYVSEIVISRN